MEKKKNWLIWVVLAAVVLICGGLTVKSLFDFGIIHIDKPYVPQYIDIGYNDLGSAKFLDGKTAWVSIFASDGSGSWDFTKQSDCDLRDEMLSYYPVAAEWIAGEGKKYGFSPEFVFAQSPDDSLLYYEAKFDMELLDSKEYKQINGVASDEWFFVDENIDSGAIREKYGCDNVVYAIFLNTPADYYNTAMAMAMFRKKLAYPYEMLWLPANSCCPAVVAHETLHTFGATDLYTFDGYGISYGQPFGFDIFCTENYPTDIMLSTADAETGEKLKDRITREITDITAYYIGWVNDPPFDVDGLEMIHSHFEKNG